MSTICHRTAYCWVPDCELVKPARVKPLIHLFEASRLYTNRVWFEMTRKDPILLMIWSVDDDSQCQTRSGEFETQIIEKVKRPCVMFRFV